VGDKSNKTPGRKEEKGREKHLEKKAAIRPEVGGNKLIHTAC